MAKPVRLDVELVRRGLTPSRAEARRAVADGLVLVRGIPAERAATMVLPSDPIVLAGSARAFVSRGGEKLAGALDRLGLDPAGRRWLDAGASTGGFTDCLLQRGATGVIAADVGYGQIAWSLRNDPRVVVMERVNVRNLSPDDIPWIPQGVTADLSFISLVVVLPALVGVAAPDADFTLLVKPQFEAGRDAVGRRGVVDDPAVWHAAITRVVSAAGALGIGLAGAVASHLPGPAGNREFFVHLRAGATGGADLVEAAVAEAAT